MMNPIFSYPASLFRRAYNKMNDLVACRLFDDYARIKAIPQHLDVINVGSNPAKFGLDYADCDIKGYNLAVGPQTLEYDFRMVKNYHSFLEDNGPKLLLLLFCPFSLCKFRYAESDGEVARDLRYYLILHHSMINRYEEKVYRKWRKFTVFQLLKSPRFMKRLFRPVALCKLQRAENPLDAAGMEQSGRTYIDNWKREFGLENFCTETIPAEVDASLRRNSAMLDEIIAFCREREIHPVIVLPPVSSHIMRHIPEDFRRYCTYSIIEHKAIPILDYTSHADWADDSNFVDALLLNKSARIKFTKEVVSELRKRAILQR